MFYTRCYVALIIMEELKFDKETAEGLYRIFCGLSSSCYQNAEVYDEAKPNMKKSIRESA
jgi:hypothetical protein